MRGGRPSLGSNDGQEIALSQLERPGFGGSGMYDFELSRTIGFQAVAYQRESRAGARRIAISGELVSKGVMRCW